VGVTPSPHPFTDMPVSDVDDAWLAYSG
jgi:hypothetical protein